MQQEAAKAAAKRLYQKINLTGGALQSYEISSLLTDTYEFLKIPFKPTTRDIKTYSDVLDVNRDGQVTLQDLQQLALQYLCGPGVLSAHSIDSNYKMKKLQTSSITSTTYTGQSNRLFVNNQQLQRQQGLRNYKNQIDKNINIQTTTLLNSSQKQYNYETKQYLSITQQIFNKYADNHYTLTVDKVADLLSQTYDALGRKGYMPNEQDVRIWMKLCDGNGDGHVQYEQYEYFVVRSLERSGFDIYS